ncbi:MAG TPA: hypothetical protein VE078_08270 [Thermoanaerobaculia bacterium]|nr:hypothetical protein [Thermoanaerobaculia bacterium]
MAFEPSWLAARASFALAVCLAAHGKTREALGAVGAGRLFGRAAEDSEKPLHQWLEGRVEGYLGDSGEAREKLDSARRKLLAEHRWIEAGLVSLDLAALDAEAKRDRIEALMADLLEAGGEAAAGVVAQFRELTAPPKARAALLGSHLLLSARYRGLGAPPIPWVWRIAG